MKLETLAVHAGYSPDPTTKAVAVPIYQTAAYAFDSAQHGADLFDLKVQGNIYTRIMNPTSDVLEKRVAALEGGIAALALASGMAAITYAIQTIAEAGDNIVSASHALRRHLQPVRAHACRSSASTCASPTTAIRPASQKLIDARTKADLLPSRSATRWATSPTSRALAEMAHRHGVPLIVDNTVPSPYLCRPIEHGADIVVHSLTKYMGGHGTSARRRHRRLAASSPGPSTRSASRRLNEPDLSLPRRGLHRGAGRRPPTSAARAWCRCATPARRSRRSTPS